MPDTRGLWTALTHVDGIGTQTQSSSPVSGHLFARMVLLLSIAYAMDSLIVKNPE